MTTEPLKTFKVVLLMKAECPEDVEELFECAQEQTGEVVLLSIKKSRSNKI